jgi:hypothetical protein
MGNREIWAHFLSAKEYLETEARTRSPTGFALPTSGRGSSIRFLGVNLSSPALKRNTLVDISRDGGGDDIKGSWAANPKSAAPARENHMSVRWMMDVPDSLDARVQ